MQHIKGCFADFWIEKVNVSRRTPACIRVYTRREDELCAILRKAQMEADILPAEKTGFLANGFGCEISLTQWERLSEIMQNQILQEAKKPTPTSFAVQTKGPSRRPESGSEWQNSLYQLPSYIWAR